MYDAVYEIFGVWLFSRAAASALTLKPRLHLVMLLYEISELPLDKQSVLFAD